MSQRVEAEYALNEGGCGQIKAGQYWLNEVQCAEKVYWSLRLEVKRPGGHSALPTPNNAIYRLAAGLTRLAKHQFPIRLNETTRAFFERLVRIEKEPLAAEMKALLRTSGEEPALTHLSQLPYYNSRLRTTCAPTLLSAGHAENALPQTATAVVNCRLLPGESPREVRQTIVRILADEQIQVTPLNEPKLSPPSPLNPEVMGLIERITHELWPGIPVVPTMGVGGTDAVYLRQAGIPTYGVSGIFEDLEDIRAHGQDERVRVRSFFEGLEFLYRLTRGLSA